MSEYKVTEVARLLAEMSKTVKVVSMYPEDNPLPVKLKESFNERFIDFIAEIGSLSLQIACGEITYNKKPVYKDPKGEDSLAALFHNSGITELRFTSDFDFPQSNQFFRIVKRFLNREEGASDLVSLLWQTDIRGLDYWTLEDTLLREYTGDLLVREDGRGIDFITPGDIDTDSGMIQYNAIFLDNEECENGEVESADEAQSSSEASEVTTIARISPAERHMGLHAAPKRKGVSLAETAIILNDAFALREDDWSKVRRILEDDVRFDMYDAVVDLLCEMLWHDTEYPEFADTVATVERVHSNLLREGRLRHAALLISELKTLEHELSGSRPRWAERIHTAHVIAGGHEVFKLMAKALNDDSDASAEDLSLYLRSFGWEALAAEVDLLGDLEHAEHRLALCDYLVEAGGDYVDIIARVIYDKRWYVVRNTVYILARIGNQKALTYLEKALHHEEARVRLEVAKGLLDAGSAGKSALIAEFVWDIDDKVSRAVIDGIIAGDSGNTLNTIITIVNDERFGMLRERDQETFLIIYSKLAGENAVGHLSKLIAAWGLFPSASRSFYRRVAFQALAENRSQRAETVLIKYSHSLRKRIRRLASQALVRRREIVYGE